MSIQCNKYTSPEMFNNITSKLESTEKDQPSR